MHRIESEISHYEDWAGAPLPFAARPDMRANPRYDDKLIPLTTVRRNPVGNLIKR